MFAGKWKKHFSCQLFYGIFNLAWIAKTYTGLVATFITDYFGQASWLYNDI